MPCLTGFVFLDLVNLMTPLLVLVSGPPGAGKSTLSRGLVSAFGFAWLDKDCIDEPFSPGDRGDRYTREVEPRVLAALINLAQINLDAGMSVLVDLPWSHILLNEPSWIERISSLAKGTSSQLAVLECVISPECLKQRMSERGLDRDQTKLQSDLAWADFLKRDRVGEKNPLPHFEIDLEMTRERCLEAGISYLNTMLKRLQ